MNYKVLVNLAKDPIISHFSGNECCKCIHRKELFHIGLYQCITLGDKLVILLIANRLRFCGRCRNLEFIIFTV